MKILETLERLSFRELTQSAERLISEERKNQHNSSRIWREISRRRVHLELGYKHVFDYCVRHLGLSEGSTWRRIQVANVCRERRNRPAKTLGRERGEVGRAGVWGGAPGKKEQFRWVHSRVPTAVES